MACDPFDVTVSGESSTVFDRLKTLVESQGGSVEGDQNTGKLSADIPLAGAFAADYVISGNTVTITVAHKPLLIPCSLIESKVNEFVGSI
jgi:hypothetical protein